MAWNVLDDLESFQLAGKFPNGLESFQIVWKLFDILQKLSRFTKTFQVALLPCYLGFSVVGSPETPDKVKVLGG